MADIQRIRERVQLAVEQWKTPSLAIGIIKDGKVVLNEAFGYADMEQKKVPNADTVYRMASCSKAFTATGLAKLVDEGKLTWDTKVKDIDPNIQFFDGYTNENVTVRDLLCHRTGLPENEPVLFTENLSRDDMLRAIRYVKPNWPIRTHWCYNNACYIAAGRIIETITGKTWEEYTQENLFDPLGMTRSYMYLEDWYKKENSCTPYETGANGLTAIEPVHYVSENKSLGVGEPIGPAGSIASTINDMLKWIDFQLSDGVINGQQYISKKNMQELHKPQMVMDSLFGLPYPDEDLFSYGLGWFIESYRGHKVVNHSGGIHGFGSLVWMVPDINLGMIVCCNVGGNMSRFALVNEVVDEFIDAERTDWQQRFFDFIKKSSEQAPEYIDSLAIPKVENTTPSHPLGDYVGTYHNDVVGDLEIVLENDALKVKSPLITGDLVHFHYDSFTITNSDYYLAGTNVLFATDKRGTIHSVSVSIDVDVEEVFTRK